MRTHQGWCLPMSTSIQPSAVLALFFATLFYLPQIGADDRNEPDDRDQETVEREFAQTVEEYNTLFKQDRFDEALALGQLARLLQPENPVAELMVLKAKFARQDTINRLSIRFKATVAADVPQVPDGSNTIEETCQITDGIIHRLVYGKDEDVADGQRQLDASLERRIEAVDLICRLTGAQKRKLRLAGRGDIKRFFDRVKTIRPKPVDSHGGPDGEDLELCGNGCFPQTHASRPPRGLGLYEEGSLFSKTLNGQLTVNQAAAFEAATLLRSLGFYIGCAGRNHN